MAESERVAKLVHRLFHGTRAPQLVAGGLPQARE